MAIRYLLIGAVLFSCSHNSSSKQTIDAGGASALDEQGTCQLICQSQSAANCADAGTDSCLPNCISTWNRIAACHSEMANRAICLAALPSDSYTCEGTTAVAADTACAVESAAYDSCLTANAEPDASCASFCNWSYALICNLPDELASCLQRCTFSSAYAGTACKAQEQNFYNCYMSMASSNLECVQGVVQTIPPDACTAQVNAYSDCVRALSSGN